MEWFCVFLEKCGQELFVIARQEISRRLVLTTVTDDLVHLHAHKDFSEIIDAYTLVKTHLETCQSTRISITSLNESFSMEISFRVEVVFLLRTPLSANKQQPNLYSMSRCQKSEAQSAGTFRPHGQLFYYYYFFIIDRFELSSHYISY